MVGDRVLVGDAGGSVTVAAVEVDVDVGRLFAQPRGRQYFAAQVEGCAGPSEHGVSFEADYFSVQLADRTVHGGVAGVKKPALAGGTIPAGGCVDGWVTFTIPKGQPPVTVLYDGSPAGDMATDDSPGPPLSHRARREPDGENQDHDGADDEGATEEPEMGGVGQEVTQGSPERVGEQDREPVQQLASEVLICSTENVCPLRRQMAKTPARQAMRISAPLA